MATYQVRLPAAYSNLYDWVDEISWFVWGALKERPEFNLSLYSYGHLWEIVQKMMQSYLTTYRSCGLWSYCHANLSPSPWMLNSSFHPEDVEANCYLIEVKGSLDELVSETTDRLCEWLSSFAEGVPPRSVMESDIERALRLSIGQYLYENPNCGTSPFCQGRIPVDPWQTHKEMT